MLKFKRLACGSEDVTQYNTSTELRQKYVRIQLSIYLITTAWEQNACIQQEGSH